jgi:phosphatidylinositol phospholipase C delta
MVAETDELFELWDTSLRKLFAIRQGLMTQGGNMALRESMWERQYWKGADTGQDRKLSFHEVELLCWKLNANLPPAEIKTLFFVNHSLDGFQFLIANTEV